MVKRIRKHFRYVFPIKKPSIREPLYTQTSNFTLNTAQLDRISFSVLRNNKNKLRKIENISYEISIDGKWEWVVRSATGIKKYKNKDYELTWVCNDIKRNYLVFRKRFRKNNGLDLY